MRDAVIVSTARTAIGKANHGAFNITHGAELGGYVVHHAVLWESPLSRRRNHVHRRWNGGR
jgi:hypothetical protein